MDVKFDYLVLAQCVAALNIKEVTDCRVYEWEKATDPDFTFEHDVTAV